MFVKTVEGKKRYSIKCHECKTVMVFEAFSRTDSKMWDMFRVHQCSEKAVEARTRGIIPFHEIRVLEHFGNPLEGHKCDARCEGAKGHQCYCSCGGQNHGKALAIAV